MCTKLLEKASEFTKLKHIYCQTLVHNKKNNELINFVQEKLNENELSASDEFNYYIALSFYYDGKYEKARNLVNHILQSSRDEPKYIKLHNVLKNIEKSKNKGNILIKLSK